MLTAVGLLAQQVAGGLEELLGGAVVGNLGLVSRLGDDSKAVDSIEVVLVPE